MAKLIDILKIINRDNSIMIKDNGNVVFEGMVKDSVEVLNNMYNTSTGCGPINYILNRSKN